MKATGIVKNLTHPAESLSFDSFDLERVMAEDVRGMCEVISDEYLQAAEAYLHELMEMQFPADHYRAGNKLPSDPNWETHPNRF